MTKTELQTEITNSTKSIFMLASAVSRLPESETRYELIYNHDRMLERLANLYVALMMIDRDCCYFGFTDKCPGCACADCSEWKNNTYNWGC